MSKDEVAKLSNDKLLEAIQSTWYDMIEGSGYLATEAEENMPILKAEAMQRMEGHPC